MLHVNNHYQPYYQFLEPWLLVELFYFLELSLFRSGLQASLLRLYSTLYDCPEFQCTFNCSYYDSNYYYTKSNNKVQTILLSNNHTRKFKGLKLPNHWLYLCVACSKIHLLSPFLLKVSQKTGIFIKISFPNNSKRASTEII